MLLEEGADISAVSTTGLNALHSAAQGDQPRTLYFFHKVLQMDINSKDNTGNTPLHWAIFSESELSAKYIVQWMNDLNLKFD